MHVKPSNKDSKDALSPVDGDPHASASNIVVTAPESHTEGVKANPNRQNQGESSPVIDGMTGEASAKSEEPIHGDWMIVTRKKRNKHKNQRPLMSNDKEKENIKIPHARVYETSGVVEQVQEGGAQKAGVVVKRGPGKRVEPKENMIPQLIYCCVTLELKELTKPQLKSIHLCLGLSRFREGTLV
ncbi:hypothetical protein RIF29_20137 [Crotalaria pallida]|uniref:Uncharacterized protein n=1 Tax=Crotalaria pallida TaxID=3830 RepID=A0AAN9F4Y9_CROPI